MPLPRRCRLSGGVSGTIDNARAWLSTARRIAIVLAMPRAAPPT